MKVGNPSFSIILSQQIQIFQIWNGNLDICILICTSLGNLGLNALLMGTWIESQPSKKNIYKVFSQYNGTLVCTVSCKTILTCWTWLFFVIAPKFKGLIY